jgi:hypothetical protein
MKKILINAEGVLVLWLRVFKKAVWLFVAVGLFLNLQLGQLKVDSKKSLDIILVPNPAVNLIFIFLNYYLNPEHKFTRRKSKLKHVQLRKTDCFEYQIIC